MFFCGLPSNVTGKFLQKDTNKYKECQANESRKNSFTEKKESMERRETNSNANYCN